MIRQLNLPDRADSALIDAAFGYRVTNQRYRGENEISDVVASRDLRRMTDAGLLVPHGERRGRYYVTSEMLRDIREAIRDRGRAPDPYDLVRLAEQPSLPGLV